MKGYVAVFFLTLGFAASAFTENTRMVQARQALDDGLPQVAIYKLQNTDKWSSPEEKSAADLLLGRALFSAGRLADASTVLEKVTSPNPEAEFWLAETLAALDKPAAALKLYQNLAADSQFASRAVIGLARSFKALNNETQALSALGAYAETHPGDNDVLLEWAGMLLDSGDAAGARKALSHFHNASPEQQLIADYLDARALMLFGKFAQAEAKLKAVHDEPAALAAALAIALAECRLNQRDPGDGEKILETFVEENSRLPGLDGVFAALDRVYAAQAASSSAELRKWSDDTKDPVRAALAEFYFARNEARAGRVDKGRQLFARFLASNPGHFLANRARVELASSYLKEGDFAQALEISQQGQGPEIQFIQGQIYAALSQYKEAASAFLQAVAVPDYETASLTNSAICAMLAGIPDAQNQAMEKLQNAGEEEILEKILFYEALHQASQRKTGAAERLRKIADGDSAWSLQARLALAEWDNLQLDLTSARAELQKISSADSPEKERSDYLAVFLADTGEPDSDTQVGELAETFLKIYPQSAFEPEVRMKLGEMLFRRGDYLGAHGQFDTIAGKFPDSQLAEKAMFLSAQAMSRSMSPDAVEQAIELYNDVVKGGGPLALRARLSQAMLFNSLKRPKDALGVLENILASKPDPELRSMTLIEQGDTYFSLGNQDPANFTKAIASWKEIPSDPAASKEWSHQALVKMGAANVKLGDNDAALDCYYGVFSKGQKSPPEYFWYYKAGFDAGRLLETQKLWKEAIAVYEKIGSVDGPRAGEARDRVNKLRLENFIWEN